MPPSLKLALIALALLPASASATTYYATPTPDEGAQCGPNDPCAFAMAKELAVALDDIQLGAGTYVGPLSSSNMNVAIHGAPGTRPKITGVAEAAFSLTAGSLSGVELEQTAGGSSVALFAENATVDNVIARSTGAGGVAMHLRSGAIVRSSVALAPAADGRAVLVTQTMTAAQLRGVTAVSGGGGLLVSASSGDAAAIAVNSILRGAGFDVSAQDEVSSFATASLDHSAYRPAQSDGSLTDLGGNIPGTPLLEADGIHQQLSSPTRNAGRADANAASIDIDGQARAQNAAPDIGADERSDPPPPEPVVTATPTPDPTPAPTAEPTPAPTATPLDFSLPGLISAKFSSPPVVNKVTDLVIEVLDPDTPVMGVLIDLGPAGFVGHLACTNVKPGPPGTTVKFTIPVLFTAPGLQTYTVEIRAGGCDGAPQTSRADLTTQVGAGAMVARIAQAPPARCSTSLQPKAGNEAQLAAAVVCLINKTRKAKRLKLLKVNLKLVASARAQGSDMLSRGYYNHQRPGGPSLKARTRKAKYRGDSGENLGLASGSLATPAAMMKAWMASPPHRANILRKQFRAIGVHVVAKDPMKRMNGAGLYTINFGTRK